MDDLLTTKDASKILKLGVSTLNHYRVSGRGPAFHKVGPQLVRYDRADLDEWARSRRYKSTSEIAA